MKAKRESSLTWNYYDVVLLSNAVSSLTRVILLSPFLQHERSM